MKLYANKCGCDAGALTGVSVVTNFAPQVRRTTYQQRATLVVPVVMLRQAVVNGAFVAKEELHPESWNGVAVTLRHPTDSSEEFMSANEPIALEKFSIGRIFNSYMDGDKLKGEAWIDIEKANALYPGIVTLLESGKPMDVSTGYFALRDDTHGIYGGKPYQIKHYDLKPDHLALLPDEAGACSWNDGCGVRANMEVDTMKVSDLVALITNSLGGSNAPEAIINELIANKNVPFTEANREALRGMGQDVLNTLKETYIGKGNNDMSTKPKPVVAADLKAAGYDDATIAKMVAAANSTEKTPVEIAAEAAKATATVLPTTVEGLNAVIANGVAAALKTALPAAMGEMKRPDLLAKVIAHTAHTKEVAEKMDTATLEIIVAGIKAPTGVRNYGGRQVPSAGEDNNKIAKAMVPVRLVDFNKAQAAAVGAK